MEYLDFEIEIGIGRGRMYPVTVVRSAAGEARETMHFPFDELALENQLLALQNALLRSSVRRRQVLGPEEQTVQDFGRKLFTALFTGEVGKRYAVSQLAASNHGKGLRLKLRILSAELAALPWEFLYDPGRSEYICLSSTTPVVRYLELAQPPRPLLVTPPLSILGMTASPKDWPELDIEREKLRLEKSIEDLRADGLVELTWLPGHSWRHLQRAMRRGPWHIFHFIGHGSFDTHNDEGLIALEDEEGKAHLLSATHLGRLLTDHGSLRLVVLNSCEGARGSERDIFSSTATILVRRGIPAILAMQYEITDRAAIELSRAFYEALADGLPVDMAVCEARKAISLGIKHTLEWGTPVLYMRSPDGLLFELAEKPSRLHQPKVLVEQPAEETPPTAQVDSQTIPPSSIQMEASPVSTNPATLAVLPNAEQCPACGAQLQPGGAFCSSCGHCLVQAGPAAKLLTTSSAFGTKSEGGKGHKTEKIALTCTLIAHSGYLYSVAISPDGQTLASGSDDHTIKLWNLSNGELLRTLTGHSGSVLSVAISPDGQTLASGSKDEKIKLWNLSNGELLRTLTDHSYYVRSVAISPDGQTLASGSGDQTIKLWNLSNGELLRTLTDHSSSVSSVAISPDGQTLASGSSDQTIKLWNLSNGELLRTLTGHSGWVRSVAISPDGQTLASGSFDQTVKIWGWK